MVSYFRLTMLTKKSLETSINILFTICKVFNLFEWAGRDEDKGVEKQGNGRKGRQPGPHPVINMTAGTKPYAFVPAVFKMIPFTASY